MVTILQNDQVFFYYHHWSFSSRGALQSFSIDNLVHNIHCNYTMLLYVRLYISNLSFICIFNS